MSNQKFPIGTLVEIIKWDDEDDNEWAGMRMYVRGGHTDHDGSFLYTLGPKESNNQIDMNFGFGEESLVEVNCTTKQEQENKHE